MSQGLCPSCGAAVSLTAGQTETNSSHELLTNGRFSDQIRRGASFVVTGALVVAIALAIAGCKPSEKSPGSSGEANKTDLNSPPPTAKESTPNSGDKQSRALVSDTGSVIQTKLGPAPETTGESIVSLNGLHSAWVERKSPTTDFGDRVVIDGTPGKWYQLCDKLTFSPDGNSLAYRALKKSDSKSYVVLNGRESRPEERIVSFLFSPDGKHSAYVASRGDERVVVVDGKEEPRFKAIFHPGAEAGGLFADKILFSPDGKRHAYIGVTATGKKVVVVDGKPSPAYDEVFQMAVFYGDSEHFAYVARNGSPAQVFVVADGQAGPRFDIVKSVHADERAGWGWMEGTVGLSPDGRRMYYIGVKEDKETSAQRITVVLDNKILNEGVPGTLFPQFSPDSARLVYAFEPDGKPVLFVGEEEQPPVGCLYSNRITFSPNGKRFAFVAGIEEPSLDSRSWKRVVVVDGKPGQPYTEIEEGPVFSADSTSVAYVATESKEDVNQYFVVQDGKEVRHIEARYLQFAPAGHRLAYLARTKDSNNTIYAVVDDGRMGESFKEDLFGHFSKVFFSPDGKRLAHMKGVGGLGAETDLALVVDGQTGPTNQFRSGGPFWLNNIMIGPGPFWSDDSKRFGCLGMNSQNENVLVVDGEYFTQKGLEVETALFAPKSGKLVVLTKEKLPDGRVKDYVVFFEGQRGPTLDELVPQDPHLFAPVFSADGNHVAYAGKRGDNYVVVRDGKEGPPVNDLLGPLIDNIITRKLAFAADGSIEYLAVKDGSLYRIVQK